MLIQTTRDAHAKKKRKSDSAAANLPFEENDVGQRCDGVVKRKAEGSGNAMRTGGRACASTGTGRVNTERHAVFVRKTIPLRSRR